MAASNTGHRKRPVLDVLVGDGSVFSMYMFSKVMNKSKEFRWNTNGENVKITNRHWVMNANALEMGWKKRLLNLQGLVNVWFNPRHSGAWLEAA